MLTPNRKKITYAPLESVEKQHTHGLQTNTERIFAVAEPKTLLARLT